MAKAEDNYGKVLLELGIPGAVIQEAQIVLTENKELYSVLKNPTVTREQKHRIIDAVFPKEAHNFLKVLCDNGKADCLSEIYEAYQRCCLEQENKLEANLFYANELSEKQLTAFQESLAKKYNKNGVKLVKQQDSSLIGGFLCRIEDVEYDYSVRGRLNRLHKELVRG